MSLAKKNLTLDELKSGIITGDRIDLESGHYPM